jgi:hypothetical protein
MNERPHESSHAAVLAASMQTNPFEYSSSAGSLPVLTSTAHNRSARDEMNLAEFPLTVLSTRTDPSKKTLEFKDSVRGKNGEILERSWIITGADKFGLPTASDDEVLLGLLKLTVDSGIRERKIFFTRYELLRTLKWTTEGRSYQRLQKALDRLSGVRIKATNAFFDNENKAHSTRNFGIIDGYEIHSGKDVNEKTSFFTWSETIFKSFQVGFIKKLDLDFYLDLQSAVAKRLYRYLDKHFWYKSKLEFDLFTLAHEKLGVPRTYQFASSIKQLLDPAFEELKERNFISGFSYGGKGKSSSVTIFSAQGKAKVLQSPQKNSVAPTDTLRAATEATSVEGPDKRQELMNALVERGIKAPQATRLVAGRSDEMVLRIEKIIQHFDLLVKNQSRLISKSPVGFLYRAVENPETFVLSGEQKQDRQQSFQNFTRQDEPQPFNPRNRVAEAEKSDPTKLPQTTEELTQYIIAKTHALQAARASLDPKQIGAMTAEVEKALTNLRTCISPSRFREAVHHGVDEKILKHISFPEFEAWKKK